MHDSSHHASTYAHASTPVESPSRTPPHMISFCVWFGYMKDLVTVLMIYHRSNNRETPVEDSIAEAEA